MADKVNVRTLRPRNTTQGLKAPGDEYEGTRPMLTKSEAVVVELVASRGARSK
jgi:hypothetical protein